MQSLSPTTLVRLWAIARRVVPEVDELSETARRDLEAIVDHALAARPDAVRRQFAIFLGVIDLAPVLRWGRPFRSLDGSRQDAVLRWFQDGPVGLFRQGFWGLRTLVLMGYYGRREAWPSIGYAPLLHGNEADRG